MTINDRIFELVKKRKITQAQLANALAITQSTVATWKQRGTIPPMSYTFKLAEILDTSAEYLITGEEPAKEHYSEDERSLVATYRKTNQPGRLRILEYAKDMAQLHPDQGQDQESLSISKIS